MPRLERLRQEYETLGFDFRIVYVREAHPGENFPHHTSCAQKVHHAVALRDLEGVRIPIVVDSLDGATHQAYGMRPNMIYVIDREGIIRAADVNADYTIRPEPSKTVAQLRALVVG